MKREWDEEPPALTPQVMGPEEEMPPATPVNAAMPEFLASLRTLLTSTDTIETLGGEFPAEAAQDFAHGTNELLNYLLQDVIASTPPEEELQPWTFAPQTVQDLPEDTNELLSYLLHEVVGAAVPVEEDRHQYTPEASEDFVDSTAELLDYLLRTSADAPRQASEFSPESLADFQAGTQDLLNQLLAMAEEEPRAVAEPTGRQEYEPPRHFESPVVPIEEPSVEKAQPSAFQDLTRGLLDGLLANAVESAPVSHGLGEVPHEYIDESDQDESERVAGPFELLLDSIDAELGPPPQIRGVSHPARATAQGERFIAFDLAGESYALPFDCVLETDRVPKFTYVPGMPAHVRGVLNLRGDIIPLVDLRLLFAVDDGMADGRMVVIRDREAKQPLALVVDRLIGLASYKAEEISRIGGALRCGIARTQGRTVALLDPDRVAAAAQGDEPIRQDFNSRNESYV